MTNRPNQFPIKDVQFHEERLRENANAEMGKDEHLMVAWHTTALAYLTYGAAKGLKGPAAERVVDGKMVPCVIMDELFPATDSHGMPYFKHKFKDPQ